MNKGILFVGIFLFSIFSFFMVSSISCIDSDGGINAFEKGTVSLENSETEATDRCFSYYGPSFGGAMNLAEYYCSDGEILSEEIECLNGCVNGSCVDEDLILCEEHEGYILDNFHNLKKEDYCIDKDSNKVEESNKIRRYSCIEMEEKVDSYNTGRPRAVTIKVYESQASRCACVEGKCLELNFFQKIWYWIKNIF